jgi:hypothetical protein
MPQRGPTSMVRSPSSLPLGRSHSAGSVLLPSALWLLPSDSVCFRSPSPGRLGEFLPLTRPSFWRPQQPLLRVKARCPLLSSFRPHDLSSFRCPFIRPQRLSLREPHLYLELQQALASLQPPFRQPQQPSHPRLHQIPQQHPLLPLQRRSPQPLLRDDLQCPFLLLRTTFDRCSSQSSAPGRLADMVPAPDRLNHDEERARRLQTAG